VPQLIEVPGHGQVEFPDGMSDDAIAAAIKKNLLVGTPSDRNPGGAGMAKFAAGALGLPVDAIQSAINIPPQAAKLGLMAFGNYDLANKIPMLRGSVGGSEWLQNALRKTGVDFLNPDNPAPGNKAGTAAYDLASRGGFIPGGVLPALGSMAAEKIGGPDWAGVGALTPQAGITAYNAARAPSLARQESQNAVRDETLRNAREAGYVASPSALPGGGSFTNALESLGGKAATGQQAALRNQELTTSLARREAGLPENSAISVGALESRRNALAAPYREAAAIDPHVAADVKALSQARFDANANYRFYDAMPNPEILAKAKAFDAKATQLETFIEDAARNAGKPGLIDELRTARRNIAKTWDVERSLNVATGDVSAPTLGRMVDRGKPLSGGLDVAGRFQQAFPKAMGEGASTPQPNVSALNPIAAAGLGLGGYGTMGWPGALLAALPFARAPVRAGILSDTYQNAMMPSYSPAVNPAPNPQLLYQLGILSERR
jgi:hypothetical protein